MCSSVVADSWDVRASWWRSEVADDPVYRNDIEPLFVELIPTTGLAVDLGCGEGQTMRSLGGRAVGVDLSRSLLVEAARTHPVIACRLPDLSAVRAASFDIAYTIYVLELLADHEQFFEETARVVRQDGCLVVIMNHPAYTAPGAGPILDDDGETLWRWGRYFGHGTTEEPAGDEPVTFHHRPLDDLLTAAAGSGWVLDQMHERGLSDETVRRIPGYVGQQHVPRILGIRWTRGHRGDRAWSVPSA